MAKENKFKLDLKPQQILLLLDELEVVKTNISIRSNEFDVQIQCISNLSDFFQSIYSEKINDKIELYERQYRRYQNKYVEAQQLGLKISKKEKISLYELSQLIILFDDFSELTASHSLDYLDYEDKLPASIKKELAKRLKEKLERNAGIKQILDYLSIL